LIASGLGEAIQKYRDLLAADDALIAAGTEEGRLSNQDRYFYT
jgi:hypothetical protein